MKAWFFLMFSPFFLPVLLFAQQNQQDKPQYLFDGRMKISGFGAPIIEFSSVNGELSVSSGGGGAVLLNNKFFIGGYGMGLANDARYTADGSNLRTNLNFGHGGFWFGGLHRPHKLIHLGISAKMGWGSITLREPGMFFPPNLASDNVFVATPQIEAEVNIAKWFKINVGGGYRLVSGLSGDILQPSQLNSGVLTVGFLFGWFD